jgi:outer membrane lipoprotein-sorting protein
MKRFARTPVLLLLLLTLALNGCLFRSRKVQRTASTAPLKSATQQQLIDYVNSEAAKIKTLNLTVDIATSVGGVKKGKVTEYKEIRGYILLRKPAMLRLIGLMPIVRNRAFDMVSNGDEFKLYVPPTNKFYVGPKDVVYPSPNALENLRPQMFYDALMLHEIDPENEIAVLESGVEILVDSKSKHEVEQPDYTLDVIRKGPHGWYLSRKIQFSRTDLLPREQLIYDQTGRLVTDAHYDNLKDFGGIMLAETVEIWRPQEEYSITLKVLKVKLNDPIGDQQFALEQPPGATVVRLDRPREAKGGDGDKAGGEKNSSNPEAQAKKKNDKKPK